MPHRWAFLAALLLSLALSAPAGAKDNASPGPAPAAAPSAEPPPKVRELLDLMADPQVRTWLEQRRGAPSSRSETASPEAPAHGDPVGLNEIMTRLGQIQTHVKALLAALPDVADDFRLAGQMVASEFQKQDVWRMLRLIVLFLGLGYGLEWLFWRATWRVRERLESITPDTVGQRLRVVGSRFAFAVGLVLSFAAGSVGAFLALDWPRLLKDIVLGYLLAFLALRLAAAVGRFLLAPGRGARDVSSLRIVPMRRRSAKFWYHRVMLLVGCVAFGLVIVDEFALFGISDATREIVNYGLGLLLLVIVVDAVWRAPRLTAREVPETPEERHQRHARATWLGLYFTVLWLLWVSGAMTLFWIAAIIVGLPAMIRITERSVNHVLRPPGQEEAKTGPASVAIVCFERGLRSLIIIGAIAWLGYVLRVDLANLTAQNTLVTRALRGTLTAVIVILSGRFRLEHCQGGDRYAHRGGDAGGPGGRRGAGRGGSASGTPTHPAAHPAQHALRRAPGDGRHDGAVRPRRRHRPAGGRRQRGGRRHRLRRPDPGPGHHQRHVLSCSTMPSGSANTSRAAVTRARSNPSACARSSCATIAGRSIPCPSACSARSRT